MKYLRTLPIMLSCFIAAVSVQAMDGSVKNTDPQDGKRARRVQIQVPDGYVPSTKMKEKKPSSAAASSSMDMMRSTLGAAASSSMDMMRSTLGAAAAPSPMDTDPVLAEFEKKQTAIESTFDRAQILYHERNYDDLIAVLGEVQILLISHLECEEDFFAKYNQYASLHRTIQNDRDVPTLIRYRSAFLRGVLIFHERAENTQKEDLAGIFKGLIQSEMPIPRKLSDGTEMKLIRSQSEFMLALMIAEGKAPSEYVRYIRSGCLREALNGVDSSTFPYGDALERARYYLNGLGASTKEIGASTVIR